MEARKVSANNRAPNIITLFSEYFVRTPPTKNLEIKDATRHNPDEHTYLSLVGA